MDDLTIFQLISLSKSVICVRQVIFWQSVRIWAHFTIFSWFSNWKLTANCKFHVTFQPISKTNGAIFSKVFHKTLHFLDFQRIISLISKPIGSIFAKISQDIPGKSLQNQSNSKLEQFSNFLLISHSKLSYFLLSRKWKLFKNLTSNQQNSDL